MAMQRWIRQVGRLAVVGSVLLYVGGVQAQNEAPRVERLQIDGGELKVTPAERPLGGAGIDFVKPSEYWLGVECYPVSSALRAQLDLPEGQGLVVADAKPEWPAGKAGIKQHDVLLAANDKPLKEIGDLVALLNETKDKEITFKLMRGGKTQLLTITPIKRPLQDVLIPALPAGQNAFVPDNDPAGLPWHAMVERLQKGEKVDGPLRFEILQPGMLLPPGAAVQPPLPDNITVTITKQGSKSASITVKQADESGKTVETWNTSEDKLDALPESVRGAVAGLLGRMSVPDVKYFNFKLPEPAPPVAAPVPAPRQPNRAYPTQPPAGAPAGDSALRSPRTGEGNRQFERQFDDLARHMEQQQKQLQEMAEQLRRLHDDLGRAGNNVMPPKPSGFPGGAGTEKRADEPGPKP